ncbi:hypothetical protein [Bacillus cereus]|uniref:hypothetical protein n=1 Tax=Bacillus cereus TaxID=1396 RepID=UPI001A7F042D|nr:hypothetical protein [Bacillus cereus]
MECAKFKKLAQVISKVSWSHLRNILDYKEKWYKKQSLVNTEIFVSSQLYSNCGYQNKDVKW